MERHAWWSHLRHGGMLISPSLLDEFFPTVADLDERAYGRLRDAWLRFSAQDPTSETSRGFAGEVLERFLGLGGWQKAGNVDDRFKHTSPTGARLRPDWVLLNEDDDAQLVVRFDMSTRVGIGRGRRAHAQLVELIRATGVPVGLLTNGRQFRLIHAGPDYDAWAEWDAAAWFDEGEVRTQLNGLLTLLGPAAFEDPDGPRLHAAIDASRSRQGELASVLGEQVREAIEILLAPLDAALRRDPTLFDRVRKDPATGQLLAEADVLRGFYQAATRLVMRLVVVLFAEARDLLPQSSVVYHGSYGVEGLFQQLSEASRHEGDGALEDRRSAWPRIMTLFRIVHGGSFHETLPIRAYGGSLFRAGDLGSADIVDRALGAFEQLEPTDLTVLEVLRLLKIGRVRVRKGKSSAWVAGPVDFSDLRTEYIGIVYEGLLDYELRRVPDDDAMVFLNLGKQPALPLSRLEALSDAEIKELIDKLKKEKATAAPVVEEEEEDDGDVDTHEDEDADVEDEESAAEELDSESADSDEEEVDELRRRVLLWSEQAVEVAGLARRPRGRSADIRAFERKRAEEASRLVARISGPEELYLIAWGGTRKGTGTYYTRPPLAVPTVRRTLEPLCYERVDGQLRPRSPAVILSLKVCDPAMGSGSFLVAALRYLTEALADALEVHGHIDGRAQEATVTLPFGQAARGELQEELLPVPPDDERFHDLLRARLKRHIVERCLYGVDINPLAVELARLALWVETLDRELPFEFLDHKLKTGNSLVGCWLHLVEDYPAAAWDREGGDGKNGERTKWLKETFKDRVKPELATWIRDLGGQQGLFDGFRQPPLEALEKLRERFAGIHDLPRHQREAAYADLVASDDYQTVKAAMDRWCAVWFWPPLQKPAPTPAGWAAPAPALTEAIEALAVDQRFFHWELEFPDVFSADHRGFDAVIGNPPWDVAKPNSKEFFSNHDPLYRTYGKQEALRVQRQLFERTPSIEDTWIDYQAGFKAMSNVVGSYADPFSVSIARGREGTALAAMWEEARRSRMSIADARHPYRHQGSADLNTYKLFLEAAHHMLRDGGRLGFVVPSGIWTDKGTTALRQLFLTGCSWEWCYGFENREAIFPIHRSFKFAPIVVERGATTEAVRAAFMRHAVSEWGSPDPPTVDVAVDDVRKFAPATLSFMEFKDRRDLEITEKIYGDHKLLGELVDSADARYNAEFHMTNDSRFFTSRSRLERDGLISPEEDGRDPRVRARLRSGGYLPLYQGGMVWLHDPYFADADKYVSIADAESRLAGDQWHMPRVCTRNVASSTNQRSLVVGMVPPGPHGNSSPTLDGFDLTRALRLKWLMSSLVLDYVLRMKVSTNLNWFFLETLPIPTGSDAGLLEMVAGLNLLGVEFGSEMEPVSDPVQRLSHRLLLDAAAASLFGLNPDDFAHVCSRFPIYDKEVPAAHRYPELAKRVFVAWTDSGEETARTLADRVACDRRDAGHCFGFDEIYTPEGGWKRANEEAREILDRAGVSL